MVTTLISNRTLTKQDSNKILSEQIGPITTQNIERKDKQTKKQNSNKTKQ